MNPFEGGFIGDVLASFLPWIVSGFLAGWFAISIAPKSKARVFVVAVVGILSTALFGFGAWANYSGYELTALQVLRLASAFALYLVSVIGALFAFSSMPENEHLP